jgi:hypothetical protein
MASKEQPSTDPSTPNALRARASTDPTPSLLPPEPHVPTAPGLGPEARAETPGNPPVEQTPPMGIVVPAASRVKPNKNSVELLLEGMQGPQPERPKTTPQTDGQASASYHAEHGVHPARTSPDDEPKVVVERAPLAPTTRIDRVTRQTAIDHADALRRTLETQGARPQRMAPRLIAALIAGMTVVLGLFLLVRLVTGGREPRLPIGSSPTVATTVATTVAATPPAAVVAAVPPSPPQLPVSATAPLPAAAKEALSPGSAAPRPALTPSAATAGARPRNPRAAPTASSNGGTDLGEFKTTFH